MNLPYHGESVMAWMVLMLAEFFEVDCNRTQAGLRFSRPLATVGTVAAMTMSFVLLVSSLKSLSLRIAYAAWTDIGTVEIAPWLLLFRYSIDWTCLGASASM
jgi:multidrug transporter EmrE-like cation transporter